MRVMVTAAEAGPGRWLVEALLDDPSVEHVLAVIAPDTPQGPVARGGTADRLTVERVDLTHSRELRRLLFGTAQRLAIGQVVHGALRPLAHGARARQAAAGDVEATRELVLLAERHRTIRQLVYRSFGEVYRLRSGLPLIIDETHPLELGRDAPDFVRERVEADLAVSLQIGLSRLRIVVLRCAECLAPDAGSQLFDYLSSRVCLRPLGFDPMLNLMSAPDLTRAQLAALAYAGQGIFNIPGYDTLPLSALIAEHHRIELPAPGFLLEPLYLLRTAVLGSDFRYDLNRWRFHYGGVLDGRRAAAELGYRPVAPLGR